jgi:hypothetical protein
MEEKKRGCKQGGKVRFREGEMRKRYKRIKQERRRGRRAERQTGTKETD